MPKIGSMTCKKIYIKPVFVVLAVDNKYVLSSSGSSVVSGRFSSLKSDVFLDDDTIGIETDSVCLWDIEED